MKNCKRMVTSVYGLNSNEKRADLRKELYTNRVNWNGGWCVGGNWDIIRFPSEKLGGRRISSEMKSFSYCINSHLLIRGPITKVRLQ